MTPDNFRRVDERFVSVNHSRTFNRILDILYLRTKKVLDVGCGYGEYLVKFGKNSMGLTTILNEVDYGKARGLKIFNGNAEFIDQIEFGESFEAIWANNLFEHLLSPHNFLMRLKKVSTSQCLLVLGVPVIPGFATLMRLRRFAGSLAVNHVNFFTRKSLVLTVERAGWHVKSARPFWFSNEAIDTICGFFAPHVYVVAINVANFKYSEKKLAEWKDDAHYNILLDITGQNMTTT